MWMGVVMLIKKSLKIKIKTLKNSFQQKENIKLIGRNLWEFYFLYFEVITYYRHLYDPTLEIYYIEQ